MPIFKTAATAATTKTTTKSTRRFGTVTHKQAPAIAPAWLTYSAAERYSSIGARTLQERVREGVIRSSNVCAPGASRGKRLLCRASLDAFILAGVDAPPTALAMNANKKGANL